MFKVQRFTADDDDEAGSRVDSRNDSTNILNKVLERAKARASKAKRARLGNDEDIQDRDLPDGIPLGKHSGTMGGAVDSGASVDPREKPTGLSGSQEEVASRGCGVGLTRTAAARGSSKDRTAAGVSAVAVLQEQEDTGEESSSEEEREEGSSSAGTVSSGQDGAESGDGGDSSSSSIRDSDNGDEKKDAEMRAAEPAAATGAAAEETTQVSPGAAAGDGVEGLRPMEEVAEEWGLDSRLAETLREEGVKHFFPIQVMFVQQNDDVLLYTHARPRASKGCWYPARMKTYTPGIRSRAVAACLLYICCRPNLMGALPEEGAKKHSFPIQVDS